jgi:hypothetical protein
MPQPGGGGYQPTMKKPNLFLCRIELPPWSDKGMSEIFALDINYRGVATGNSNKDKCGQYHTMKQKVRERLESNLSLNGIGVYKHNNGVRAAPGHMNMM